MELLNAALLGILQGATEFLPISSSGHLILAERLFRIAGASMMFDVFLHLGTVTAILIYFRDDFTALLGSLIDPQKAAADSPPGRKLAWYILFASLPAIVVGLFFKSKIEEVCREPGVIAATLALFGLLLLLADKGFDHKRHFASLTMTDAMLIGCGQAMALVPGVSRSGITMTVALMLGIGRPAAARFSFLLGTPVILGAGLLHFKEAIDLGSLGASPTFYLTGFVAAAISGYFFILLFLRFIQTRSLAVFAWYRIFLAAMVILAI